MVQNALKYVCGFAPGPLILHVMALGIPVKPGNFFLLLCGHPIKGNVELLKIISYVHIWL